MHHHAICATFFRSPFDKLKIPPNVLEQRGVNSNRAQVRGSYGSCRCDRRCRLVQKKLSLYGFLGLDLSVLRPQPLRTQPPSFLFLCIAYSPTKGTQRMHKSLRGAGQCVWLNACSRSEAVTPAVGSTKMQVVPYAS